MEEEIPLENQVNLQEEVDFIGHMSEDELNEAELTEELQTDLMRLLDEGEEPTGDERSRRICRRLEGWLKQGLGRAVQRYRRRHPSKVQINY